MRRIRGTIRLTAILALAVAAQAGSIGNLPTCASAFQANCAALTPGGYTVLDTTNPNLPNGTALDIVLTGDVVVGYATFFGKQTFFSDPAVQQAVLNGQAQLATSRPVCGPSVTSNCYAPGISGDQGSYNQAGSVFVTNLETSSFIYRDTPVSRRVDQYATTLVVTLNGTQTILNQTYNRPFGDAAVQSALQQAEAVLAAGQASFGSPLLAANTTTFQGNQSSLTETGRGSDGKSTVITANTFGPAIVNVSNNFNSADLFSSGSPAWVYVLPGQLNINLITDFEILVTRDAITTGAYLTAQTYSLNGISGSSSTPEPGSMALMAGGLGAVAYWRRKRKP